MSWSRRIKCPARELPKVYIWQQYTPSGFTMRIFIPNPSLDLGCIVPFDTDVRWQLDRARFRTTMTRQYRAYAAVQWLWTDEVDSREKVEQGLRDAEQAVLKLLIQPAGWTEVPPISYFLRLQDVARTAQQRGMGDMWMLGGS